MRLRLFLLISSIASLCTAQNKLLQHFFDGTHWTDGNAHYYAQLRGDFVNMSGGTLHEGGCAFGLQCTDAQQLQFTLQEGYWNLDSPDEGSITFPCPKGSVVQTQTYGDNTYLLVQDQKGDPVYSFRLMHEDETLRDIHTALFTDAWVGDYSVAYSALQECPVGTSCTVTPDNFSLGSILSGQYQIMDEFESPTNVVRLDNGLYLRIRPAGQPTDLRFGLSLYGVNYSQEDDLYGDERLLLVLDRKPGRGSRWPYTLAEVLLPAQITMHPRPELRLLRNEIYARHGYRFGSADLANYFRDEFWYQPDSDPDINSKVRLTTIESVNVSLIRAAEANENLYFEPLDEAAAGPGLVNYSEPLYRTSPWPERRTMIAHFECHEVEIASTTVTPYNVVTNHNVTFEWCKADGNGFYVGLCHQPGAEGETKYIVIRKTDSDLAYPMIQVGEGEPLPEVTIHIAGDYLWFELKGNNRTLYYFYNLQTHVLDRSDRRAYQSRIAPPNADATWLERVSSQLSPKAE